MVSLLVKEKLYINEVVLGTSFGILMGPHCAGIFTPREWGDITGRITLEVMRIVLATGLFAIGVELPRNYMWKHARGLVVLVVPTMAIGWLIVAAIIYGLFPRLDYVSSLAIAACLTPTDPIISAAIVGGRFAVKHVPINIRQIIAAESAANDGLAYPFLTIGIYLTLESSKGIAFEKWFIIGWLYQVFMGVAIGAIIGRVFAYVMKFSQAKGFIDRESYVAQFLALAFLTIGVTSVVGSDDLLAAFAAGSAISWDGDFNTMVEGEVFASVIDLVLNCACFIYIGAWLPFDTFNSPDLGIVPWRLVVFFISILALRRIPSTMMLYKAVPEIRTWKEALFCGHFGPMGVGAIYIQQFALERLGEPEGTPETQADVLAASIQPIVSFVVLGSIIVHGLSIPFFSFGRNLGRAVTLTRTQTVQSHGASSGVAQPDWLLWARRPQSTTLPTHVDKDSTRATSNRASIEEPESSMVMSERRSSPPALPLHVDVAAPEAAEEGASVRGVQALRRGASRAHTPTSSIDHLDGSSIRGAEGSPSGSQTPKTVKFTDHAAPPVDIGARWLSPELNETSEGPDADERDAAERVKEQSQ
ncbi:Sodium/hydrogen exchanger family-domain-containing protein [Schizophyllum amplum]|uniref:Sodium/hydrogen exchanger family-domain-containing protein n=1 Tax=Schizophyllum amplum TaxID=97359 RepID=A0A550CXS1_9AGAR|nr:Sodium/hydrogen exchanger family-domain-containing protein [Auriculariopsis ampla]